MSTIRILLPDADVSGKCAVCGIMTTLKWVDSELGEIGDCCLKDLVNADDTLKQVYKYKGVIRPTNGSRP